MIRIKIASSGQLRDDIYGGVAVIGGVVETLEDDMDLKLKPGMEE